MFKHILSATAAVALALTAGQAEARTYSDSSSSSALPWVKGAYVGADYQYNSIDYGNVGGTNLDSVLDDSIHGINLHIGGRISPHFGLEGGYTWNQDGNRGGTKVELQGANLDLLGYLPLGASGFELIATGGATYLKGEVSALGAGSADDWELSWRAGGGAQYWLTSNINVRGLVRYQDMDFDGFAKNAIVADAGLNFQF